VFEFCLRALLNELNAYINAKTGLAEEPVIYANPSEYITSLAGQTDNKVVMSVVDIWQEGLTSGAKEYIPQGNKYISKNQPLIFSLYILFATYFQTKPALAGLSYLSSVIAFFQHKNHFTQQNTPLLQQKGLDNISVSLVNLTYQEKSALWTGLGMAYRPSVVYKVGMIAIADMSMNNIEVQAIKDIYVRI